jgi:DNA-binding NarL/FixJ family response regulator|tara:strand:- start:1812 stop:2450 length:639 start_codon:yes stop_codon:yes gene_type:complete
MKLSVAIVEDDAFTRTTLHSALDAKGLNVVFSTADASEAVRLAQLKFPHVALLDLHLGKGPTGVDVAVELRRQNPNIGLIFLTSFDDPRLLDSSIGELPENSTYVTKSTIGDVDALVKLLYTSALGKSVKSSALEVGPLQGFTRRQMSILRLVALGFSNSEIAKQLFITEKSVESAIRRLAHSLNIRTDPSANQRVHLANVFLRSSGLSALE